MSFGPWPGISCLHLHPRLSSPNAVPWPKMEERECRRDGACSSESPLRPLDRERADCRQTHMATQSLSALLTECTLLRLDKSVTWPPMVHMGEDASHQGQGLALAKGFSVVCTDVLGGPITPTRPSQGLVLNTPLPNPDLSPPGEMEPTCLPSLAFLLPKGQNHTKACWHTTPCPLGFCLGPQI